MWAKTFEERLQQWVRLRDAHSLSDAEFVKAVNEWWFTAPWSPYYLHWDDRGAWPTPWQLLSDNTFCSLARGLGVIYTLALSGRSFAGELIEADADNLVLVEPGKYTLNYQPGEVVNIELPKLSDSKHRISIDEIKQKLL